MATKKPHYRDYATLLELAVIADDAPKANFYLKKVIAQTLKGAWMFTTTPKDLKMIDA